MQDRYKDLANLAKQGIDAEQQAAITIVQRLEHERRLVEVYARRRIKTYEQEKEANELLLPQRYENVIKPWWEAILESGLYEQLKRLISKDPDHGLVVLNDRFKYYWPDGLYEEIEGSGRFTIGEKPFSNQFRDLQSRITTRKNLEVVAKEYVDDYGHSIWEANIYLTTPKPTGVYVSQWPSGGGGCGFNARRYRRVVSLGGSEIESGDLNPEVLLQFANQIEDGTVTRNIESQLRGRK